MTVQTEQARVVHTSDGIQTQYGFNFETNDVDWIFVFDAGIATERAYEVILNSDQDSNPGGVVNYLEPPPANGETVTLVRYVPVDQETDYTAYDSFPAESHEGALDKLTLICQQLQDASYRSIKVPIDSTEPGGGTLPGDSIEVEEPIPGHGLQWGEDGISIVNSTLPLDDITAEAAASAAEANASAIAAAQSAGEAADSAQLAADFANASGISAGEAAESAAEAAATFDLKLGGYTIQGFIDRFIGDANDLNVNSTRRMWVDDSTNLPPDLDSWAMVETMAHDATRAVQYAWGYVSAPDLGKLWIRIKVGSIWGAWAIMVDPNAGGDTFLDRLKGYELTGFHADFAGDLNTILANSRFFFAQGSTINFPPDFDGNGMVETIMANSIDGATQLIYGHSPTTAYKIWMRQLTTGVWDAWILIVGGESATVSYVDAGDAVNAGQASDAHDAADAAQSTADQALADAGSADANAQSRVARSGDTMGGVLELVAGGSAADAMRKDQIDQAIADAISALPAPAFPNGQNFSLPKLDLTGIDTAILPAQYLNLPAGITEFTINFWDVVSSDAAVRLEISSTNERTDGDVSGFSDGYLNSGLQASDDPWDGVVWNAITAGGFATGIFGGGAGYSAPRYQGSFHCYKVHGENLWMMKSFVSNQGDSLGDLPQTESLYGHGFGQKTIAGPLISVHMAGIVITPLTSGFCQLHYKLGTES